MEIFQALADPARRRIVEVLSHGERPAGQLAETLHAEFGISQPATSRHLRILRESGVAVCTSRGAQRRYHLDEDTLDGVASWLDQVRKFWRQRLDALDTELLHTNTGAASPDQPKENPS